MKKTSTEFADWLRSESVRLATGEIDEIFFSDFQLDQALNEVDRNKITASYIRTVMNRVGEIKEIGRVKVRRTDGADRAIGFSITINKQPTTKVFSEKDVPRIKAMERRRFAERLLGFMPSVMHLEGDEREGAIKMVGMYQDMIKKMMEDE